MTTGTRVMYLDGIEVCIGTDGGHYDGTIPEYNIRKLTDIVTLNNLSWRTPLVASIMNAEGYGSGYSDTSKLYPITAEQEAELMAIDQAVNAGRKAASTESVTRRPDELCPKCGTYCYGDCEA